MRVALVTVAPSPHLAGILAALGRQPGVQLRIWCRQASVADRRWEADASSVDWGILEPARCDSLDQPLGFADGPNGRLVLASSYFDPLTLWLAAQARHRAIPTTVWWERPSLLTSPQIRILRRAAVTAVLARVGGLVGVTDDTLEFYRRVYGFSGDVERCPYHRDLSSFFGLRGRDSSREGRVVFVTTAALVPRKGVGVAIRSLAASGVDGELVVVGDGPSRTALEDLAASVYPGRVTFLGRVPYASVAGSLKTGGAFLFPSRFDGFGVAVMEALAAGLPVIASAETSAARQYVRPGINGYILPANDVPQWARTIRRVVDEAFLRSRVGEQVRESINTYDVDIDAARLRRFLERLKS